MRERPYECSSGPFRKSRQIKLLIDSIKSYRTDNSLEKLSNWLLTLPGISQPRSIFCFNPAPSANTLISNRQLPPHWSDDRESIPECRASVHTIFDRTLLQLTAAGLQFFRTRDRETLV